MKKLFIKAVRWYQKSVSPGLPPLCRFIPTCSEYAIQAFEEWGAFCGFFLMLYRLLRCNPLFKGGYDPVPKRKIRRTK